MRPSPAVGALLLIAVTGCNPGTPISAEGHVLLRWGHLDAKPLGLWSGRLAFDGGCIGVAGPAGATLVVLWPPDTGLDTSTGALRVILGGVAFAEGDEIRLGGGEYEDQAWAESLVGPIPAACETDKYLLATRLVDG